MGSVYRQAIAAAGYGEKKWGRDSTSRFIPTLSMLDSLRHGFSVIFGLSQ